MADYLATPGHKLYDVSPDDQRFAMLRRGPVGSTTTELIMVENWAEELKERAGMTCPTLRYHILCWTCGHRWTQEMGHPEEPGRWFDGLGSGG